MSAEEIFYFGDEDFLGGVVDLTGQVQTVYGKRTVRTGKYYPPYTRAGWDYEPEHEPGGLEDMKTHVLLQTGVGEIETCDVEPA